MKIAIKSIFSRKSGTRTLVFILIVVILTYVLSQFLPVNIDDYGLAVCIPAVFLLIYIFITKRILEALTLSSFIGFIMISRGTGALILYSGVTLETLMSEDIAWLIIVCGLMGCIIALTEKAGGTFAFGTWISKYAKGRKSALLWTWVLGVLVFIDDYLNSLTVASCMSPLTDKYKVPREMLSYVVDSTAAPLCVLIPISTWAVFCSRILESAGWAPEGEGILYFIKTIPYNFYGWIAALMVPLVIIGIIPAFGTMKKAELRVKEGGPLAPEGSDKIDIRAGEHITSDKKPRLINFILPIIVLIVSTIYFEINMMVGVIVTMAFIFVLFLGQNLMTAEEYMDAALLGLKNMLMPLLLMVFAFIFAAMNDQIGFTQFVINSALPLMTPEMMPFIVFILLALTEFITGTNWGMYIIAFPIVIPLAMALNANIVLVVSAVLSAGIFGSHICFYSDATVLSSAASGCNNFDHAMSQAPYGLIAAFLSACLFLLFGFIL